MGLWELFVISVGLSMDAFAVSICKGLSVERVKIRHAMTAGLYFGGFQAIMPLLGYWLGSCFQTAAENVDHWIAFALLGLIGIAMIRDSRGGPEELDASFSMKAMLPLAVAASIDALAVGVTFAFLQVGIVTAVSLIGVTAFAFSAAGIEIGSAFGAKYRAKAEWIGGLALILMGLKILLEHTGILLL